MRRSFLPGVEPPADATTSSWWFALRGGELLVRSAGEALELPRLAGLEELGIVPVRRQYLGALGGRPCFSVELDESAPLPAGMELRPLRSLYGRLADDLFAVAGRAAQIVEWERDHQFCGRCAALTELVAGERARRCPRCSLMFFPRLAPAVILLIERGDAMLLARSHGFPEGLYSALAGFVEPGESLEEAVEREVEEEVGLEVDDLRYFGSQPWPYPNSLMIGFTARSAGGSIRIDPSELADAAWFEAGALPELPPKLSIARALIDSFLAGHGGGDGAGPRTSR